MPSGASVAASNRLVPHLAQRRDVRLLGEDDGQSEYVVAAVDDATADGQFPAASLQAKRRLVARRLRTHGVLLSRDGVVVLRRR